MTSWHKEYIKFHPEVEHALKEGKPVVALESTVITHGLPFPENEKLAKDLETEIQSRGCTTATIAILDGMIHIGLDEGQLERLAQAQEMLKISVRDITSAITKRMSGGTTVAGTLAIAEQAGIKVFATGGIGGVHREALFDISADLGELAKARLVVVCAGAKAILDIPATLEVLETYGVPVIGYQTSDFPAFYSISSGLGVSARADSAEEVAMMAQTHWDLGQKGSILVAVPPPLDVAVDPALIEAVICTALEEARKMNIHGQGVTPFLLRRVSELTGGVSLKANLGLLRNNAQVAAEIANFMYKVL
jgi:pseudouridine-5'-phosphate glycosidase